MNVIKKGIVLLIILVSTLSFAQNRKYLPESKDLVGLWQQVGNAYKDTKGNLRIIPVGNYKVINNDGTFYTFMLTENGFSGMILYGEYKTTSDSTLEEYVIHHSNERYNNSSSIMKYKIIDNDFLLLTFKNMSIENGKEIKEVWVRVKTQKGPLFIPKSKEIF